MGAPSTGSVRMSLTDFTFMASSLSNTWSSPPGGLLEAADEDGVVVGEVAGLVKKDW
jgi:hypothetical protein